MKGFTLIELALVLAIITIISTIGLYSFTSFNQSQLFATGVAEVESLLATARSNAQSQIIPSVCNSSTLNGYKVVTVLSGPNYELDAVCDGVDYRIGKVRKLPGQLSFQSGSAANIFFNVSTGTVTSPGSITLTGYGKSQTIYINKVGSICYTSC